MSDQLMIRKQSACTIRPPQPEDASRMADLAGQLGYKCSREQSRGDFARCGMGAMHSMLPSFRTGKLQDGLGSTSFAPRCWMLLPKLMDWLWTRTIALAVL